MTTNEQFIKAWMTSDTRQEVAEKLGVNQNTVYMRSNTLRKKGVQLPKLSQERKRGINVSQLNSLIKSLKDSK